MFRASATDCWAIQEMASSSALIDRHMDQYELTLAIVTSAAPMLKILLADLVTLHSSAHQSAPSAICLVVWVPMIGDWPTDT